MIKATEQDIGRGVVYRVGRAGGSLEHGLITSLSGNPSAIIDIFDLRPDHRLDFVRDFVNALIAAPNTKKGYGMQKLVDICDPRNVGFFELSAAYPENAGQRSRAGGIQ